MDSPECKNDLLNSLYCVGEVLKPDIAKSFVECSQKNGAENCVDKFEEIVSISGEEQIKFRNEKPLKKIHLSSFKKCQNADDGKYGSAPCYIQEGCSSEFNKFSTCLSQNNNLFSKCQPEQSSIFKCFGDLTTTLIANDL